MTTFSDRTDDEMAQLYANLADKALAQKAIWIANLYAETADRFASLDEDGQSTGGDPCQRCGRRFRQTGLGRPRKFCQICNPSR